jgi:ubiquinone/menaquinone biosynthesis C-methylase UbiE
MTITRGGAVAESADPRLETLVVDEETLPFSPASFDLAVSALALQW